MAALGQKLKAAREAKGLSESDAAAAMKMLKKTLIALETEDFSSIAAPTYARGFIRMYAKYLELDPEPLIAEYNAAFCPETPAQKISAPEKTGPDGGYKPVLNTRMIAIGISVLIVMLVFIACITNCARRHAAAKTAGAPAPANTSRALINKPLPDLYLVDHGKIEQK